ncbi:30S ribosomal protein S17 [Patescibacteria group bacterium]|nr:30S ribosomal protein S17 [Patescibacteria group bacterium]
MNKKKLKGIVVSSKMAKTLIVEATRLKLHKKYKKQFKVTGRYKVHDEKGQFLPGDKVIIQESRPLSKDKRWVVLKKV